MADIRRSEHRQSFEFTRRTDDGDASVTHQRGQGILEKLIQHDPENREELEKAHVYLQDDPDYTRAMHAAALTIKAGKINVFISYRLKSDSDAARQIAEVLRSVSRGKIEVTLADEFTTRISGQDYREEIQRTITRAHWFIILLSDPKQVSEWSMYETGMFRASMVSKRMNRLICIHHPEARLPDQIYEYQSVSSTPTQLINLLDGLLCQPNPLPGWAALRPDIDHKILRDLADELAETFRAPSKPVNFNHSVQLEVTDPSSMQSWRDLLGCPVETDRRTPELFGKIEAPQTWGELIENVVRLNATHKWLEELHAVITKVVAGNVFRPISGTFESSYGGRVMRPILHSMEHDGTGNTFRFNIYFVDEILSAPAPAVPDQVRSLLTALRMGDRIRWEVLERFRDVEWQDDQIAVCATAFSRIEREGQSFGNWDVEELCANYPAEVRDEVRALVVRWRDLKGYRPGDGVARAGELDLAFRAGDVEQIRHLMDECRTLIGRFLVLTYPVLEELTLAAN